MARPKKIQTLIDVMNERSEENFFDENEDGNSWLIFFLIQMEEYRGFYRCVDLDGNWFIEFI